MKKLLRLGCSPWSNTLNLSEVFVHSIETEFSDLQSATVSGSFIMISKKKKSPSRSFTCFQESKHANLACHVSGMTTEANICSIQGCVILESMAILVIKRTIIKLKA